MKITYQQPQSEDAKRTHVCVWVTAGDMSGFRYLTLQEAREMLNQLQQAIWRAEAPEPETEE
jgi:hypothetical protein